MIEMNKEHRNFLFQVFDQIQENVIKEGQSLEGEAVYLKDVLGKIKKYGSLQGLMEKILINFIDSTGADTN